MENKKLFRILIVDDEELIRQGIKHYMEWEDEGFQIVGEAANGHEALELIEGSKPHIVLTDIVMPIMDGEEFTRILKEKYPQIEIIILSSYGEFDYVRSTFQHGVVDYILKPNLNSEQLLTVLDKARKRISSVYMNEDENNRHLTIENYLDKLISGYDTSKEDIICNQFPYPFFYVLGVDFKQQMSVLALENKDRILTLLKEDFQAAAFYSINPKQSENVYIVNVDESIKFENFLKDRCNEIVGIGFVLSERFTDIKQIRTIYRERIVKLFQYRFYLPNHNLLRERDLLKNTPNYDSFNLDWFTEELTNERFDSAFTYLINHSKEMTKQYTMEVTEFKTFFGHIMFNIIILLGNMKYDVMEIEEEKYTYFQKIEAIGSACEVLNLLEEFLMKITNCIHINLAESDKSNIKRLIKYIDEHYMEPLTLTSIAKHFHFNPSYLSNYFSTHNNVGFIEYVNKLRINEAAKQLRKTSLPVSEICTNVGYSDHSYFCKVFKKMKGLSPSQYRKK